MQYCPRIQRIFLIPKSYKDFVFLLVDLDVRNNQRPAGWRGRVLIDDQHGMYSYHRHHLVLVFTTLIELIIKVFRKENHKFYFFWIE